jgi:hypothetical protein
MENDMGKKLKELEASNKRIIEIITEGTNVFKNWKDLEVMSDKMTKDKLIADKLQAYDNIRKEATDKIRNQVPIPDDYINLISKIEEETYNNSPADVKAYIDERNKISENIEVMRTKITDLKSDKISQDNKIKALINSITSITQLGNIKLEENFIIYIIKDTENLYFIGFPNNNNIIIIYQNPNLIFRLNNNQGSGVEIITKCTKIDIDTKTILTFEYFDINSPDKISLLKYVF